ncbi:MAG: glycoside hydrolase family 97 N-terminal domain-containing protein, partial [Sedimentisphaerales bacterium]|nr:glycoside hydrolase family 97 N-terminal domain-containing protein [Sedimentisphaerales bacterium]
MIHDIITTRTSVYALLIGALFCCSMAGAAQVASPDGQIKYVSTIIEPGLFVWHIERNGHMVLNESIVGFALKDNDELQYWYVTGVAYRSHSSRWKPVYGKRSVVPDVYHEMTVDLLERGSKQRRMQLTIRAYDEGIAFRYSFAQQESLKE